jgi:hypothetical protein
MRNFFPVLIKLKIYISQIAATLVGCVLLAIGASGAIGADLYPIDSISFLVRPTALGAYFDHRYWVALSAVGLWLVLFVFPRAAAISALILILVKWPILAGFAPL